MNIHEESFVNRFVVRQKRDRYLSMLGSAKLRKKILTNLYHFNDLDERYLRAVPVKDQSADGIYELLKGEGSPETCHFISTDSEIDGKELNLFEALESKVGECNDGTVVSCIPGKLAYYEGESPGVRYILERND